MGGAMPEDRAGGQRVLQPERLKTALEARRRSGTLRRPREAVFSVADCERHGVSVQKFGVALMPEERETAISYIDSEPLAEITTGDYKLQRKLEGAGFWPNVVNVFEKGGGTMRVYRVPKGRLSVNLTKKRLAGGNKGGADHRNSPVGSASGAANSRAG